MVGWILFVLLLGLLIGFLVGWLAFGMKLAHDMREKPESTIRMLNELWR